MIGNDLVYLPDWGKYSPERKESFRAKLFTAAERESIGKLSTQSKAEALYWSMKEAAYKVYFRKLPKAFYAPKKFQCYLNRWIDKEASGGVSYGEHKFLTRTFFTENYLHTIALPAEASQSFDQVQTLIQPYDKNRPRWIEDLRYPEKLKIEKDEKGIPQLLLRNQLVPHSVSISHDGDKIAFAWV